MTSAPALLWPALAQVLWTFVVFAILGVRRYEAIRDHLVDTRRYGLDDDAWPPKARAAGNNLRNQFESPVLFYALCLIGTLAGASGAVVGVAWLYVATRVVHTAIHVTANVVPVRGAVFALGGVALFVMLVLVALKLAQ
jgi:hypothetical protein